jgi:hypothetical protein
MRPPDPRHGLFEIFNPLRQRRFVEPFGATAEPMALQAGNLQLQPLDLSQRRTHEGLQHHRIVRQICGCGEHPGMLNRRYESGLMNPA